MEGVRTRGHPAALAAVGSMIRGPAPHAVLLVGPGGVGKTTLALDLAAGLLCTDADPAARPCGVCRSCRLVVGEVHPDVHRLGPEGPGGQVVIGGAGSKARGVRDVIGELALLPVEGGARVAIVESAQRMNEDAQAALLKTLEEPPAGVTLVLCADAEEPLLPTIRSRCARIRLGPVGPRAMEAILAEHGLADPALAARLARISAGRPGLALAWATDPDALRARDELVRVLLDLTTARPSERLAGVRAAVAAAGPIARLTGAGPGETAAPAAGRGRTRASGRTRAATAPDGAPGASEETSDDPGTEPGDAAQGPMGRAPAAERRRAAEAVVSVWTDVARDLLLAANGLEGSLRDPRLLEESRDVAAGLEPAALSAFLDRSGRAAVLLKGNVSPELVLDDLALTWPARGAAAA
jgi:DNA polymerase-3 subunit delta'